MRRIKEKGRIIVTVLTAFAFLFTLMTFFPAAGADPKNRTITIDSSEVVVLDTRPSGAVDKARLITFFGINGDGTFDVSKEKTLKGNSQWQGVQGFTTPAVEGDELVWKGLEVEGMRNVLSSTLLNEEQVEEVRMRIPLDLEYRYFFDGVRIKDPADITGKSGHFRVELHMENKSAEKIPIEYTNANGETVVEETETYLPLVILPYDWYFDNEVFHNLETDPTGVVVRLPDHYQLGWSIPLFPPATEADNTIWVEADVKDFSMPPLVVSANFVFPETNQRDTVSETIISLKQLYEGVKLLHEGLLEAVNGVGDVDTEDTLAYGVNAILGGLKQMGSALPEAAISLRTLMIPGVEEVVAGIGTPETPDTLSYGVDAASKGLAIMLSGIGGPGVENTMIFGLGAMAAGLEEMKSGIGSPSTENTLLFAVDQVSGGLEGIKAGIGTKRTGNTLLYAMDQIAFGLRQVKEGIGSAETNPSLLYGLDQMRQGLEEMKAGIGSPGENPSLLYAMAQISGGLEEIKAGVGSEEEPESMIGGMTQMINGLYQMIGACVASIGFVNLAKNEINDRGGLRDLVNEHMPEPYRTKALGYIDNPLLGINAYLDLANEMTKQIWGGIGDPGEGGTLLYGLTEMKKGALELKEGIGTSGTENTLLWAIAQVEGGLKQMQEGIGSAGADQTLLYALEEISRGLADVKEGIGSSASANTLLYAVSEVEKGLAEMQKGIGSRDTSNTMLFAMSAMSDGLEEIKEGIGSAATADSLLWAIAQVQGGLEEMKAGIGSQGADNTLLFAMASVQNGLQQMRNGLASGDPNHPGLKEGLVLLAAGLDHAVEGLGNEGNPESLVGGMTLLNGGVMELKGGLEQATSEGTAVMLAGLSDGLSGLYLTQAQLEAIKKRGEEFDHVMGRTEGAERNSLSFIYQTPGTYQFKDGSRASMITAAIVAVIAGILVILVWIMMRRKPILG